MFLRFDGCDFVLYTLTVVILFCTRTLCFKKRASCISDKHVLIWIINSINTLSKMIRNFHFIVISAYFICF